MSLYSLDSLEAEPKSSVSKSGDPDQLKRDGSEVRKVVEKSIESVTSPRNSLIADERFRGGRGSCNESRLPILTNLSSRRSTFPSGSSIALYKKGSSRSLGSSFKNDKKLGNVLPPVVKPKTKQKTYLERYRDRLGIPPAKLDICSPEGSTLSIFGDTSQRDSITELESRPPSRTPRDDQSEHSFYRRLIEGRPRTTRSYEADNYRTTAGNTANLRSVSDQGLNLVKQRVSYRPYNIRDYQCLTVPQPDRSLGPDNGVEMQEKWEKLMRRTQYGDLASFRNRQNVIRRCELLKCKRNGSVQKSPAVQFPLKEDAAEVIPGQLEGSKDKKLFTAGSQTRLKNSHRTLRCRGVLTIRTSNDLKNSTKSDTCIRLPSSKSSLLQSFQEKNADRISSLEDLQQRHQTEKRIIDLLINRTLVG